MFTIEASSPTLEPLVSLTTSVLLGNVAGLVPLALAPMSERGEDDKHTLVNTHAHLYTLMHTRTHARTHTTMTHLTAHILLRGKTDPPMVRGLRSSYP